MRSVLFDLGDLHCAKRRDLSSLLSPVRIGRIADHGEVRFVDLCEEFFLLLLRELVKIVKDMCLSVFRQFLFCFFKIHSCPLMIHDLFM